MDCHRSGPQHFRAYRELLFADFAEEVGVNGLQDLFVPGPVDPLTGIPTHCRVGVAPAMSTVGALGKRCRSSSRFDSGGSHGTGLEPAELRLVYEWLDIGAQYFNDPVRGTAELTAAYMNNALCCRPAC